MPLHSLLDFPIHYSALDFLLLCVRGYQGLASCELLGTILSGYLELGGAGVYAMPASLVLSGYLHFPFFPSSSFPSFLHGRSFCHTIVALIYADGGNRGLNTSGT